MISLRTRLVLLVLVAILPVFGLVIYTSLKGNEERLLRARESLLILTRLAALSQERSLEGVHQLLDAIASSPSVKRRDLSQCTEYLRNLRGKYPAYINLGVLGPDGNLACGAVDMSGSRYAGDRAYFKQALATRSFAIGEYIIGRATGLATINFALPAYDDHGQLKGVAFAALDLRTLAIDSEVVIPPNVNLTVTDRNGVILWTDKARSERIGTKSASKALRTVIATRQTQASEAIDPDGAARLYAAAAVGGSAQPGLFVSASMLREEVIAPAQRDLFLALALLTWFTAGMIGARWIGDRTILAPARRLLKQVSELAGAGALGGAGPGNSRDEIAELSAAFKRMAAILKAQEAERDSSEAALRRTHARLLTAQRIGHIGNWEVDIASTQLWCSDQVFEIFAAPPGALSSTYESFISRVFPADRQRLEAAQQNAVAGAGGMDIEYRIVTGKGEVRWVHALGERHVDAGGKALTLSGTVQDITERKLAQDEILQLNAHLEERVRQRTEQLTALNRELESFSYSVSHDLRAPLRTIDGFAHALQADCGPGLPPDGLRYLQRIQAGARKMGKLIDDLLAFSQMSRQELRRRPCDTSSLVRELLETFAADNPLSRNQVTLGKLPSCYADTSLLRQVWTNLIGNAFKYSAKKAAAIIEIGCLDENGEQVFFVRDNGAGFDMAYADKLFGVFQRLHGDNEFEGTGVGLAIVKRIIERHEGRVWAEGVENEGATFYFTLGPETAA